MNTNIMLDLLQSNSMTILLTLFLFVLPLHLLLTRYRWVIFGKVRRTESHGGSLVADVLKAHGVRFVFTLVGGHISPLLVESKRRGIRVIDVRHEVTSVFAADAVARLTGRVGVAAVTAGPGITNTVTAVKNAQMAQSPLLLLGGAAATLLKGRGSLQDIDQMALLRPICKYSATCSSVRDIVPVLRRAFKEAASGVPGPVFVELPIDVLYNVAEISANMGLLERTRAGKIDVEIDGSRLWIPEESKIKDPKAYVADLVKTRGAKTPCFLTRPKKRQPWIVETYLRLMRRKLFADAFPKSIDVSPLPVTWPSVPTSCITKTISYLSRAKRPVIVIGSQALIRGPEYASKLADALNTIGVPCFLGGMARGLLPLTKSSLYVRQGRTKALRQADVVILLGVMVDFRLQYGKSLSRRSTIIAANRSSEDLTKNTDMFWKPTIAAQCDACDFALELSSSSSSSSRQGDWTTWIDQLKEAEQSKEKINRQSADRASIGHGDLDQQKLLNPLALCYEVDRCLGPEPVGKSHGIDTTPSLMVGDGGDFVACAAYTMRPRGGLSWLDPGAFGTLGVGGGFALGAALCRPKSDVWLIWGDGSAGYSIAEFDTFVRHGLPVIAVIGNDACWTQILREQQPMLGDDVACQLSYTEYDVVAKGYGGEGYSVRDIRNVKKVLEKAMKTAREKKIPVCVNALIGSTDFREGSISV